MVEEPETRELGEGVCTLVVDDCAVGREVAAGVALLAEEIQHAQDVLAHEDLAAGQVDLQVTLGERALQCVEGQLLAPLALDVQEIADVAELALQIAAHGRLVDEAHGQPIGAAGPVAKEAADRALVAELPQARVHAARERRRTSAIENGAFKTMESHLFNYE